MRRPRSLRERARRLDDRLSATTRRRAVARPSRMVSNWRTCWAGCGGLVCDACVARAHLGAPLRRRAPPTAPALRRRVDTLDADDLATLHRALRTATRTAIRNGGVHTGIVLPYRRPDGHCPRCGAAVDRATVGGRTTWFCPREQT